jgi:four helix bundle protein
VKESIIKNKSYAFAIKIIRTYKYLVNDKKEYVLAKQVLRSGTAIGALIEESQGGQTKKDFFFKISIAYKEARETAYWLNLLKDTNYLSEDVYHDLIIDLNEIIKIIGSIQKTLKIQLKIE